MKYTKGQIIQHFSGTAGLITDVYKDTETYRMAYADHNSEPNAVIVSECEIVGLLNEKPIGFGSRKD